MQIITEIEKRDRGYYAGFLGPLQVTGAFDLFVNLRTMEVFDDALRLYVGEVLLPFPTRKPNGRRLARKQILY